MNKETNNQTSLSEQMNIRLNKLKSIDKAYINGFSPKSNASILHKKFDHLSKEDTEISKHETSVSGRIKLIRHFGKAGFIQIQDRTGVIQVFMNKKTLSEDLFLKYKSLDTGDIIYAKGHVFKTKTNETTIHVNSFELLTKCLRPLPEKFHGITDVELRYRQRYLDLMMTQKTRDIFITRSKIIELIRNFLNKNEFLEVETPMMHPLVSGAKAKPFKTHHNTLKMDLFLRVAPELYLKRLVVGGFERVFEINRNFRNEGISIQHNPEFTMLEFYQAYATYEDLMKLTEKLFQYISENILGKNSFEYQGKSIDLKSPWDKISVEESILKMSEFSDKKNIRNESALKSYLDSKKIDYKKSDSIGELQMLIFDSEVEHKIIGPTFVIHYPSSVSPLSRRNDKDPFLSDRFELIIAGFEIANAFSELNNPIEQKKLFEKQALEKEKGDEEACDMDKDYIKALEFGLPPTAGEGIGIDRLIMLFTNSNSIRDVILFPSLRTKV